MRWAADSCVCCFIIWFWLALVLSVVIKWTNSFLVENLVVVYSHRALLALSTSIKFVFCSPKCELCKPVCTRTQHLLSGTASLGECKSFRCFDSSWPDAGD